MKSHQSKTLLPHLSLDASASTLVMLATVDKMIPMLAIPATFDANKIIYLVDPKVTIPLFSLPVDCDIEMKDGDLEIIAIPTNIQKCGVGTMKLQSVKRVFEAMKKAKIPLESDVLTTTIVLIITQETGLEIGFTGAQMMDPRMIFVLGKGPASHEAVEIFEGNGVGRKQLDMLFENLAFAAEASLHDNPQVRTTHTAGLKTTESETHASAA